jgi:hypothetical protein
MTRWIPSRLALAALMAYLAMAGPANAGIVTFKVVPAFAPQSPLSPSWDSYVSHALFSIPHGVDWGDRETDPTAYERVSGPITPQEIIYTPFNSWRGKGAPSPEFAAPFLGEFGNRVHFGLHVVSTAAADFALDDLTWELDSDDLGGPGGTGYFDQSGSFSGVSYSSTRIGIHYGGDGLPGTGDDALITSGLGTQRVHELIYVGVGDGILSDDPLASSDQADIDQTLAAVMAGCGDPQACWVNLTATYSLPDAAGVRNEASGTVQILLVPEPSATFLGGVGLAMALATWRHRTHRHRLRRDRDEAVEQIG